MKMISLVCLFLMTACTSSKNSTFENAKTALQKNRLDEAIALSSQILRQNPADAASRLILAQSYQQMKKYQEAEKQYEMAIHSASLVLADSYLQLGELYEKQNELQKAKEAYHQGLRKDPGNKPLLEHLKKLN